MEEENWKRDETPYLVFACSKCRQYLYVKTIKKNKKCLRCGRSHKFSLVEKDGEIVEGMTAAVDKVKEMQHEFALKELNGTPDFHSVDEFKVFQEDSKMKSLPVENLRENFKQILVELHNSHKEFPHYMIEFMAEKHGISQVDIKLLIREFLRKKILTKSEKLGYFSLSVIKKDLIKR